VKPRASARRDDAPSPASRAVDDDTSIGSALGRSRRSPSLLSDDLTMLTQNMQMLAELKHVATGIGGDLSALPLRIGLISEPCLAA
jgi:hypothetical protein